MPCDEFLADGSLRAHRTSPQEIADLWQAVHRDLRDARSVSISAVRSRGFDQIQQRQMVLNLVQAEGEIARAKTAALCQISEDQASRLLRKMRDSGDLEQVGRGRGACYRFRNAQENAQT